MAYAATTRLKDDLETQLSNIATEELETLEALGTALMENTSNRRSLEESLRSVRERRKRILELLRDVDNIGRVDGGGAQAGAHADSGHQELTVPLFLFQLLMILLYFTLVDYSDGADTALQVGPANRITSFYSYYLGITIMTFVGFGFLMTFLRRFGFGSVGLTMLLAGVCIQWGILMRALFVRFASGEWGTLRIDSSWLIEGDFAAITFLITFGVLIGRTTPTQIFYLGIFEMFFYALNIYVCISKVGAVDVGGSMTIHLFGASFGLAATWFLSHKRALKSADRASSYQGDIFAMIGTVFLWIYWPSFNAAIAGENQFRAIINTVLSLSASIVSTFASSKLFHGKFEMVHVQNATLAGGVAVGASADLILGTGGALLLGFCAGILSTFTFHYILPFLERKIGLQDTCGVLGLHGLPGFLGGITAIIATAVAKRADYGSSFDTIFPHADNQAPYQVAALAITLGLGASTGALSGFIVRLITRGYPLDMYYRDDAFWEVPADFETLTAHQKYVAWLYDRHAALDSDSATTPLVPDGADGSHTQMALVEMDAVSPHTLSVVSMATPAAGTGVRAGSAKAHRE